MVLLTILTTQVFSICIGVGGCGYPNSSSIMRMILASFAFKKSSPSSVIAAEAVTNFNILYNPWIVLFNLIGYLSIGIDHMAK